MIERDELVKAIRMAVVSWNTLGPRKADEDVSEFVADFLIENRVPVVDEGCGGCRGVGAHRKHCPRHPNYHPWRRLADQAESIGDSIGEPGLANRAWDLAGRIKAGMNDHPWRPRHPAVERTQDALLARCDEIGEEHSPHPWTDDEFPDRQMWCSGAPKG
jgi:hypothetical protein